MRKERILVMGDKNTEITEIFVDYFKNSETPTSDYKLGVELEHFIVDEKTLKAVSYYENDGIEDILEELNKFDWTPVKENGHIIGLNKDDMKITLEPGGQIEISLVPEKNLDKIQNTYQKFINQIIPVLKDKNRLLVALGYQPVNSIKDIPLIPKKRYDYMYDYFKDQGEYSHNMMKATASIHVNIDFSNEIDYIKKYRVAYFLSPIIYFIFDNSPFFEGKPAYNKSVRSMIWEGCDTGRRDLYNTVFSGNFGYNEYAKYLLSVPPVLLLKNNNLQYTEDKILKDLINPDRMTEKEIEYVLSMVFPDVRTKNYLEIRMGDSLPYPESLGYVVFWKGLMYLEDNLNRLNNQIQTLDLNSIKNMKKEIMNKGYEADIFGCSLRQYVTKLFQMAEKGLNKNEIKYLNHVREILNKNQNPKRKILEDLKSSDKKSVLKWSFINKI
ncbi:MAG: glutamate--cysteine ligase [Halanaerobiaceae bacterium]